MAKKFKKAEKCGGNVADTRGQDKPTPEPVISERDDDPKEVVCVDGEEEQEIAAANALQLLSKAASVMNSAEFDLPSELKRDNEVPGMTVVGDLVESDRFFAGSYLLSRRNTSQKGKRLPHQLDANGFVPRPVKVCFVCNKYVHTFLSLWESEIGCCRGRRTAHLIQCDYCPLLYHADCTDPPLSSLPKERWMCPNHVERIVVSRAV